MREKGFTLIELIGVIVLVSLMVLIIIPTVEKAVKKGEENADKQLKDNMILAAKSWAVDNKGKMPQEPGVKINIWLSDLQKDGYIERDIKLPSTGASIDEACIEVTNKSSGVAKKNVYDYVYNDNCTINLDLVIIGKIGNTPITSGTWTNKDITLTATSSYTGTYQWYSGSTAINGATKKSYVATKGTNTEGKVTYKVKMKSEKRTPEATYVAAIDKKAPAISITSKIATKDNLTISLSETSSGSGLKGYAITSSATTPTTWTAISGRNYSK
ncbi:MAG: prepilin-type N-terminal cleavage/methylation domain-containing protein [Bacilli bacterium]